MRSPISIRGYVHPSVFKSHMSWISGNSNILTNMEQNSAKNTKLYLMKENSERTHLMSSLRQTCFSGLHETENGETL